MFDNYISCSNVHIGNSTWDAVKDLKYKISYYLNFFCWERKKDYIYLRYFSKYMDSGKLKTGAKLGIPNSGKPIGICSLIPSSIISKAFSDQLSSLFRDPGVWKIKRMYFHLFFNRYSIDIALCLISHLNTKLDIIDKWGTAKPRATL